MHPDRSPFGDLIFMDKQTIREKHRRVDMYLYNRSSSSQTFEDFNLQYRQ